MKQYIHWTSITASEIFKVTMIITKFPIYSKQFFELIEFIL